MPKGPQRKRTMSDESRLRGRVTRAKRSVDRIDQEYGAASMPEDHPLFAKRQAAQQKHLDALAALREHGGS